MMEESIPHFTFLILHLLQLGFAQRAATLLGRPGLLQSGECALLIRIIEPAARPIIAAGNIGRDFGTALSVERRSINGAGNVDPIDHDRRDGFQLAAGRYPTTHREGRAIDRFGLTHGKRMTARRGSETEEQLRQELPFVLFDHDLDAGLQLLHVIFFEDSHVAVDPIRIIDALLLHDSAGPLIPPD